MLSPLPRQLVFRPYHRFPVPLRIAVGDVIVCPEFRCGVQFPSKLMVAFPRNWAEAFVEGGNAMHADDPSRGTAPFLVTSTMLTEAVGPADVAPGNHRLSRDVQCLRLTEDYCFQPDAERIHFNLEEPMSLARPSPQSIQLLGFVELPIKWDEKT